MHSTNRGRRPSASSSSLDTESGLRRAQTSFARHFVNNVNPLYALPGRAPTMVPRSDEERLARSLAFARCLQGLLAVVHSASFALWVALVAL
jgi:hypothetical protein